MFGREHSMLSKALMRFNRSGKTYEEMFGVEEAQKKKLILSEKMSGAGNPMFGRVSFPSAQTRFGLSGWYKGMFFRSLLELSFLKHLEMLNVDILNDVEYESFRILFFFQGREKTYHTDFYVKSQKTIYEVKPSGLVKDLLNVAKFAAATEFCKENGFQFKVVTENEFCALKKKDVQNDPCVKFCREKERRESDMKLNDSVLARICQIIQEAMLTGTDCIDFLRMIELEESSTGELVLTERYIDMVKRQHEEMLKFAEELKKKKENEVFMTVGFVSDEEEGSN